MEYHESVNTLKRLRRFSSELGTETTEFLLEQLGDPQRDVTAVQIAGSNGKGSTASILARILREAGLDVGLYTSPDLNDLRERIRVNGRKIPKQDVVQFVEEIWPHVIDRSVAGSAPSFFEVITTLGLWHFEREAVDVAVLEVGLGGRYDATSVVDPAAAAVTSVSLEHTDLLGDTVEEIAREKVAVAPADVPLVTGATGNALATIREHTDVLTVGESQADIEVSEGEMVSLTESTVSLRGPDWEVTTRSPMLGAHQAINAGIAAGLARQLGTVTERDIAAGIRNVHWPGRFEIMARAPLTVLDGAHNPDACAKLATLLDRFEYEQLHLVFGAVYEKDHAAMARSLPALDHVYLAEPAVDRAMDATTLEAIFERESTAAVGRFESILSALERAIEQADEDDCLLVAGSLYAVSEARDRWGRTVVSTAVDGPADADSVMHTADVPAEVRSEHADRMAHHTIRLQARQNQAHELRSRILTLGGTGTISGITAADKHVDIVLSGTHEQFRALLARIRDRGADGLDHIATQIEARLHADTAAGTDGYPWQTGTALMGVLNVTPDSFHDGGEYDSVDAAVARAEEMVAAGADVIDIGGESTRPGADPTPAETERTRILPVIDRLQALDAVLSVDTRKPSVAEAALEAGADMINDVNGLGDAAMRHVVAEHGVPAVVMHSLSTPVDPSREYRYDDVVTDVIDELTERLLLIERSGIDRSQLIVDPGLGFGKNATESFELIDRLEELQALGTAVMVGHSHKSMFKDVATDADDRFASTIAATALAAERGADMIRVHDIAPNIDAIATGRRMD
ncbi:MAG: dihydropteroate synthase [Halobacteriales archaeon]